MDRSAEGGSCPRSSTASTGSKNSDGAKRRTGVREGTNGCKPAGSTSVNVSTDQTASWSSSELTIWGPER